MTRPPRPVELAADGFNQLAPCRHGPMLFNRYDRYVGQSLARYGEFSPGESRLFRQVLRPGQTVVEVGANIGAHTVELSQLVGPRGAVIAFEPQQIVFQTLCANLALNNCANVSAYPLALGAAPGTILVPRLRPDHDNNFGGLSLQGITAGERTMLVPLDQFDLPACHFLKIDVEGMEVEVLRGAAATIAAHRPVIYAENDRAERSAELVALLRGWNYRLFPHNPPLFEPDNFAGDEENVFGNIVSINLLGVPAEANTVVEGSQQI